MTKTSTLKSEFARFVDEQVHAGARASRREILNDIHRLVKQELASASESIEQLRDAIQMGIDSGPGRDAEAVFDDLDRTYVALEAGRTV